MASPVPGAVVSVVGADATATTDSERTVHAEGAADRVRADEQIKAAKWTRSGCRRKRVRGPGDQPTITAGRGAEPRLRRTGHGRIARWRARPPRRPCRSTSSRSEQIASSGYTETAQVIQSLAPSFNFPRPTITDGTDTVRPATLRGLGPDQVLVLVNGKRRHQSALVHLNGSIGRGSTGVDLNAIPLSAIDHIEILRDGAAAQYGSDAIAGVINIVLKGGVARPGRDLELRPVARASLRRQQLHAERADAARRADDIDFSDGGLFDVGGSWGLAAGQGQRHGRGRVPAPQPHEPRVVRSARSDRRRRRRQQRRRRAESPLGRSRHARRR